MNSLQSEKTIAEVVDNFTILLEDMDFLQELSILQIRRFAFSKRRLVLTKLKALYVALWHLSLQRSFPELIDYIFAAFIQQYVENNYSESQTRKAQTFVDTAYAYIQMLAEKGDSDFTVASQHLLLLLKEPPNQTKELKLALHFRNIYTMIFNNLI